MQQQTFKNAIKALKKSVLGGLSKLPPTPLKLDIKTDLVKKSTLTKPLKPAKRAKKKKEQIETVDKELDKESDKELDKELDKDIVKEDTVTKETDAIIINSYIAELEKLILSKMATAI